MKLQKYALSLLVATLPFAAIAQDEESSSSTTTTTLPKSETGVSDLKDTDKEISNAKLRAESGSKKRFSFRSMFNYEGSNLERPLAGTRPEIGADQGAALNSNLSGLLGLKIRVTDNDSLSIRTGVTYLRPIQGDLPDGSSKTELADLRVTWDNVARVGDWQLIRTLDLEGSSSRRKRAMNRVGYLGASVTAMRSLGSGFDVGAMTGIWVYGYSAPMAGVDTREHINLGLYPILEYAFTDKVSLRTVFRYTTYVSNRANPSTFNYAMYTQSLGIGIAVTRDIYMYPNVQFDPTQLNARYTNWGFNTNINL